MKFGTGALAVPSVCVCVSTPGQRVLNHLRQGRQARHTYLTQRSYGVSREAVRDVCVPAQLLNKLSPYFSTF